MLTVSIVSAVLLLVLYVAYSYYYWPKKEMQRYKELFQSHGYSAIVRPFTFFGLGVITQMKNSEKQHKDALYPDKTTYSNFDVNISNALNNVMITLVNPQLMKEFLSVETNPKYPKMQMLIRGVKEVLGNGIAFTEGLVWKNKRKIISKAFNFELLKENIPQIVEICNRTLDQFDNQFKVDENTVKYNVLNLSVRTFNGVMLKCFFGCDQVKTQVDGKPFEEFMIKMINDSALVSVSPIIIFLGKFAFKYGVTKHIRDVKKSIEIFQAIAEEMILKRIDEVNKEEVPDRFTDIIQSLVYEKKAMAARNETLQYTNKDLINEFSTFLVAGTDTTSRYFTMIVYYLSQYPEVEKKLRAAVEEVIETDEDITYENLKKLVYIDWIQFETTRYYGPGNGIFTREASVDNNLLKVPITKGTLMSIQPASNHFNQKFFKDPLVFMPERWERQCDNLHPYAFLGFSGGPRNCIGKHLALLQSKIALIKLIIRYKTLSVPHPDITLCANFMYEPSEFETVFTK